MGAQEENEQKPLVQVNPTQKSTNVVLVLTLCSMYVGVSASLIHYNKFLMTPGRFPHSFALVACQMFCSSLFAWLLYGCFGTKMFPKAGVVQDNLSVVMTKFIPIGCAFAISVVLSNEAYLYCSVPFLQMTKELNVVMVYVFALVVGLAKFSMNQSMILVCIICFCTMSIHGELRFSLKGLLVQLSSQVFEVTKLTLQNLLLSSQGLSLDSMTVVLWMCPMCFVAVSLVLIARWDSQVLQDAAVWWPHLLGNCVNAFALNIIVSTVIQYTSSVAFILTGIVKDVCIVVASIIFLNASVTSMQAVGFAGAVSGVFVHACLKTFPDYFSDETGVIHGVYRLLSGMGPLEKPEEAEKPAVAP